MKFGVVIEVSTFLVITQVSSGFHILIFSRYKYLHVKIDSLANVKSCVMVGMFDPSCTVSVDYLSGLALLQ